jgi:hypothetical protein
VLSYELWLDSFETTNPKSGVEYWEYVLLYVDDALVISHRGEHILRQEIGKYFELKEESIGPPDIYLGGKIRKVELENGSNAWGFSSSMYVQAAVSNIEKYVKEKGVSLPTRVDSPMSIGYRPEVDVSPELSPKEASHYQSLIGILRWIVELGRIDICCEVSLLSSHLALPCHGHLQEMYQIVGYLKKHHNAEMVFDPSYPEIDKSLFERKDWTTSEMSDKLSEIIPPNALEPLGNAVIIKAYVDADHATDSMTRRSRTGFIVYINNVPI